MEFTVNKSDLVRELSLSQGVVEKKTTIPILSNILLETAGDRVVLTATDLELGIRCSCPARVRKEGAGTIPARRLLDYVRLLPDVDLNVLALAISPGFEQDETLFAGTETGIFRSANGGRAWREVNLPSGFETTLSLAISPNYPRDGALFAGTEGHGLLVSNDFGESWTAVGDGALDGPVNSIYLSPDFASRPELVALSNGGVMISRDCGKSWAALWEKVSAENDNSGALFKGGVEIFLADDGNLSSYLFIR